MFLGFSNNTIDFMWGIRFNNEKSWFKAHKEEYLTVLYGPMKELSQEVYDAVYEAYPDLGFTQKVSRIYRDARRLHGCGPYKDGLWSSIERPSEDWTGDPVFWFDLKPEGYTYGMGYYAARPVTMAKFRARLDRDPKEFGVLARQFRAQSKFTLESTPYKKPKGDPGPLLFDWYNSRNFSLTCTCEHDEILFTPALAQTLIDGYLSLMPLYRYFIDLNGAPDPRA